MPSHYKFGLWDTAVLGLLLSLTDTSCSLRLLTLLAVFPPCLPSLHQNTVITLLFSLPFFGISSKDCRAPAPGHPCAPRADGCWCSFILLCHMQLSFGEILEVASYKADDGVWSSTGCLTNTSRISRLPLTVLIYEGEQHSSFTCSISRAVLL